MKISVIIPSLNPDDKLVSVVDSLVIYGHLRKLAVIASVQYLPTRLIRVRAEV